MMCLNITMVISAPLLQLLQPYQRIAMQHSQQNLQQQLMELQTMQQFNPMQQFGLNQLQPFIVLLPDQPINTNFKMIPKISDRIENEINFNNDKTKTKEEDDSVVIDAEPMPILEEQKGFLVIPNGRLSIGEFISAIPFLPIEINVPDTISWAYNGISSGISGIISIIGSRFPSQRPVEDVSTKNVNLKSMINELQMNNRNNIRPLVIMPLGGLSRPILPFQLIR
ncbi:jg13968 [Pararge aegeria aegeria]|uniref:Jg13968 protein n=2 Tax=Pararge aegeria TaxID=116150 RepID=A0A8S4R8W4_9NEOP|nr:jg13968 [Pararge aegeria aegeria]